MEGRNKNREKNHAAKKLGTVKKKKKKVESLQEEKNRDKENLNGEASWEKRRGEGIGLLKGKGGTIHLQKNTSSKGN